MSGQDEVFGLPFLFTGGLPNSLEKFTEGNLRCFLIYLIEVVGKANRQNVWQKPVWWQSKLIPYSPISVDTSSVPQEQVVKELRGLIENCYRFYHADKILEVSKQLAEIPRILLGIRDNGDNTMTVYDNNSKAIYVTVRPENLHYDAKSLNKVSKDFQSNYTKEDVSFCQIQKSSQFNQKENIVDVIELSDTDCECEGEGEGELLKHRLVDPSTNSNSLTYKKSSHPKSSRGVVIRSGNNLVIALSDSDSEEETPPVAVAKPWLSNSRNNWKQKNTFHEKEKRQKKENAAEVKNELTQSRPCPKRFKNRYPSATVSLPHVIILSDSDDDTSITISSYTSLAKDYQNINYFIDSPSKNVQKSILGPLVCSPKKDVQPGRGSQANIRWPLQDNRLSSHSNIGRVGGDLAKSTKAGVKRKVENLNQESCGEEEDIYKPTKEELFLRKKKDRTFYSSPPNQPEQHKPTIVNSPANQAEFLCLLGLMESCRPTNTEATKTKTEFVTVLRSMRGSLSRMPLEWIKAISSSNHLIVAKKNSRNKNCVAFTDFEHYCSTDKTFIEYSIKAANESVNKEGRSLSRLGRRGTEKSGISVEKWYLQCEEGSQRSKRASLRMLRSLVMNGMSVEDTLNMGSLAPNIYRLPHTFFEGALHSSINIKDNSHLEG